MADETVESLKKRLEELNKQIKEAGGYGIDFAEAMRLAGTNAEKLQKVSEKLNKEYNELTDNADYIYRTLQDVTAELKNQNLLLKIGRGSFKELTSIAQDLNYYQKGNSELSDKQFKKAGQTLDIQKKELGFVIERLSASKSSRDRELRSLNDIVDSGEILSKLQKARLKDLKDENALLINAKETLKSGIPTLERELDISKEISTTRRDLGGIAQASGKLLSHYGGSFAQFLNIGEATDAVEEFNKKLIQGALENKEVQKKLLEVEFKKNQQHALLDEGLIDEEEHAKKILALEIEAAEVRKGAIASTNNLGNKFKSLGVFAKEIGVGLKKSLTDPVTIIKFLVTEALKANSQIVSMGKSLGTSSAAYRENIADIARGSTDINMTTANLVESYGDLVKATGFAYKFNADQLKTQTLLTKEVGLTADEAGKIANLGITTGKTSESTYKNFVKGLVASRNQLKVGIDMKAALSEAANVSGQLAANLGYNPERIAKAVVAAKAFGMTLEQTSKIGESLLNWESSISSELDAELLTGKQLNLERARAAALSGDQATLAEEIAKNVGTAADYAKMNVLQQKALATAVGMTADELGNTLQKREAAIASGKSLAQINEEDAKKALERQTMQEKFNAVVEKLSDIFSNLVAGPLAAVLDTLTGVFSVVGWIGSLFQSVLGFVESVGTTIGGWASALGPFSFILKGIADIAVLIAAYGAFAALAWIPVVGPILGAAAAAAVIVKGMGAIHSAGDMISPADGKTQVSTKEGGLFELSKNDDLMAGPGLASKKGGESIQGPSIDLTPMIMAINAVKASVDRLYGKDSAIHMDGKKVGTTLAQGSHKVA
jgi:hypothetical protein